MNDFSLSDCHTPEEELEMMRIIMEDSIHQMQQAAVFPAPPEMPSSQPYYNDNNTTDMWGRQHHDNVDWEEHYHHFQHEKNKRKSRCRWILLACGLVIVVLGVLLRGGSSSSSSDDNNDSTTPSPAPPPSLEEEEEIYRPSSAPTGSLYGLMALLPQYAYKDLIEPMSPQSQALHWLSNHQEIHTMPDWRKVQLFALATLYFSWNGPMWLHGLNESWLDDTISECNWLSHDYLKEWTIRESSSSSNLLSGGNTLPTTIPLPAFGGACNSLGEFQILNLRGVHHASSNSSTLTTRPGTAVPLPREIELLTSLRLIDLSSMGLNASLEAEIWPILELLPQLSILQLSFNFLRGSIPVSSLGTQLQLLDLSVNQLTGTIPETFGKYLTNLQGNLGLSDNRHITGALPTELGLLTNLNGILFKGNNLMGTLPTEVGLLSNKLTILDLTNNNLSGTLPSELGYLSKLDTLFLSRNSIGGQLPTQLGLMTSLQRLYMRSNQLSGKIPSQLGLLTSLHIIDLRGNQFDSDNASIPTQIGLLKTLYKAWFGNDNNNNP